MVVVVVVAAAWTTMAQQGQLCFGGEWSREPVPAGLVMLTGFYVGLPLGLVCGTIVGKLAGRWRERRWRVHVAAIMCTLLVALPPVAALHSAASAFAMVIVSLAIAVPASVMLERSTRPDEPVPLARVS
jgi:hypothetical protein